MEHPETVILNISSQIVNSQTSQIIIFVKSNKSSRKYRNEADCHVSYLL